MRILYLSTNFIPFIGTVLFDWNWADIIQIYVIEYYILLLFDALRMRDAKPSPLLPLPLLFFVFLLVGVPALYLTSLTLTTSIKFMPWSHYWQIGLIIFFFNAIFYIQTDIISKQAKLLKSEDILIQSLSRAAVVMSLGTFGYFFVNDFYGNEKGLVLLMSLVRTMMDIGNFKNISSTETTGVVS